MRDTELRALERRALQGDERARERLERARAATLPRERMYRRLGRGEWVELPADRLAAAKRVGPFLVRRDVSDPARPWERRDGYVVAHVASGCIAMRADKKRTAIRLAQTLTGLAPRAAWGIHDHRHDLWHLVPVIQALYVAARKADA